MKNLAVDVPANFPARSYSFSIREYDRCHCHNQKFSAVSNVLAFMLRAKALIKQLKELDYKSMNVSGKVSHMSLCSNKGLQRERERAGTGLNSSSCIF